MNKYWQIKFIFNKLIRSDKISKDKIIIFFNNSQKKIDYVIKNI